MQDNNNVKSSKEEFNRKNLNVVNSMISKMKFGSITLIIQDGVLIQIEKNEKIRLK